MTNFSRLSRILLLAAPLPLLIAGATGAMNPFALAPAVGLALIAPARAVRSGRSAQHPGLYAALLLFGLSAIAGAGISYNPQLSLPLLLTIGGSLSLFCAIAAGDISPRHIGSALVVPAAGTAFYFVSQYAWFDYPHEAGWQTSLGRLTGSILPPLGLFTPHPNAVATFLEGIVLLNLYLLRQSTGKNRLMWLGSLAIIGYGLLISGSRGAGVGILAVIALGLWAQKPQTDRRRVIKKWAGWAVPALAIIWAGRQIFSSRIPAFLFNAVADTANSRLTLYKNSLYLLGDYPFSGIGLDTFTLVYSRYQLLIPVPYLEYAHNLFLCVWLGQGLLGITALLWLLVEFYRFVARVERVGLAGPFSLFQATWLGVTATLIHGLTDATQFSEDRWTMPMLFALLGLSLSAARLKTPSPPLRQSQPLAIILCLAAAVGLLTAFYPPLTARWLANLGALSQTRTELVSPAAESSLAQAEKYFRHALALDGANPVANRRLGIMALERQDYQTALSYLQRAYAGEPDNQPTLKALGYAYFFSGQPDTAELYFKRVDFQSRLREEIQYWQSRQ